MWLLYMLLSVEANLQIELQHIDAKISTGDASPCMCAKVLMWNQKYMTLENIIIR